MNNITLPLRMIEDNIISDFKGKALAQILVDTDTHETCEYFIETINNSTILLLENEELKNKIEKLSNIIKKMELINANSEELIEVLAEAIENGN